MFKRIVDGVEVVAAISAAVFVILLFVDRAPGAKVVTTAPATVVAGSGTTAPALDGKALFAQNCAVCHGDSGQGLNGPRLSGGRMKVQFPDPRTQVLFVGNGVGIMPAFKTRLSQAEIRAIVDYTRTL